MNFKISDKVVCVDDSVRPEWVAYGKLLQKGAVYVVEGMDDYPFANGETGLFLVGLQRCVWHGQVHGFSHRRFRLLSDVQAENRLNAQADAFNAAIQKAFDAADKIYRLPANPEDRPNLGDWIKGENP